MWSLGVSLYQIITGEHPFNTNDEVAFRSEVTTGRIDYSRIANYGKLSLIIKNLLVVDPG